MFNVLCQAFALGLAILAQVVAVLLFCYQDLLVFPGSVLPIPPIALVGEGAGVTVETHTLPNKRTFRLARRSVALPRAVIVWFVGNAEDLQSSRYWADVYARQQGATVLCMEYPGYAPRSGRASKVDCLAAAEFVANQAQALAKKKGVPLWVGGHSLGTFMATHLAARGIGSKLLLLSPPSSILERGQAWLPFLPVRCILRHDFDNLRNGLRVRCETLVVHGTVDFVVPLREGRRVAAAIPGSKLVVVPGAGHHPVHLLHAAGDRVAQFLR